MRTALLEQIPASVRLAFRTDSDDVFAIRISATVDWRRWEEGSPMPGDEYWASSGETAVSTIVSIANYWQ